MWPRVAEALLGCWLAVSPFILRHSADNPKLWINDFASATAIMLCAGLSFWRPLRRLHLAQILVALWLLGFGYFASSEPLPALQNNILVAFVLMMFAVIPNEANLPPISWRQNGERVA